MIKLLKIGSMVVAGVAILVVLLTTFYAAEIKQLIVSELNKSLKSPVQVKDIQFSVLRHFPFASVELSDVMAMDAMPQPQRDTLLTAEHISLLFNVTGIFSNNINIKKVVMKNGSLAIRVDKDGKDNYHIWQPGTDSSAQSVIDLQKIILNNVSIHYHDLYAGQQYKLQVGDATLQGRFANDAFDLGINAKLLIEQLTVDHTNYLTGKEVKLQTHIAVNNTNGLYRFTDSEIQVADLILDIEGEVKDNHTRHGIYTDLTVKTNKAKLEQFISLLPPDFVNYLKQYRCDGLFGMTFKITGGGSDEKRNIAVDFNVQNGKLSPPDNAVTLNQINLSGTFRRKNGKADELTIPMLTATLKGQPITASLRVTDFTRPFLNLQAKANLDLASVKSFIPTDTIESLTGNINLELSFAGKVRDFSTLGSNPNKIKASGTLQLSDVFMKMRNNPLHFDNINGTFHLSDNNLEISSLNGNISSTDFAMNGMLNNFINYLLIPGQHAALTGNISSRQLNLDELMANKSASAEGDTSYLLKFNPRLTCQFNVAIQALQFRLFKADQISGVVHLQNQVINSNRLSFNSMSGRTVMNATIDASSREKIVMTCQADIENINIKELFYEMENFDQQTLTDKNLKGNLSASVNFSSDWTTSLDIKPATAKAQCELAIQNGELNNFTPILALSKYLKVADLNNIRFSTLKNEINISNRKIYIPAMEIKSTALNLTASGTHDFDNMVDYKLNMLMSDVLSKKVKERNTEFGVIEEDLAGRSKLFLTMKGPVDNPKFSYDRKGVGEKIKQDLHADKQNVKGMLKEEFGFFKKDTSLKVNSNPVQQKKKKEELQVDWGSDN